MKDFKITLSVFLIALFGAICCSFIYAAILVWLWNLVIVSVFSAPVITYWQAYAICIICNILFKSGGNTKLNDKN